MSYRRLRRISIAGTVVLLALLTALSALATWGPGRPSAPAVVPAPLAMGTAMERPRHVPSLALIDDRGRPAPLSAWRGKWVVLAPSLTLCHEVCPMTTGALMTLTTELRHAGLANRVIIAEATVDPWRDSPARLRAYRRLTGVNFELLTGTKPEIHRLWKFFGVGYQRVPQGNPPDVDWLTHKPESFDVQHSDALFFLDPAGQERIVDEGQPDVSGKLLPALRGLLNDHGRQNLAHPSLPWTAGQALDDLYWLMGREIPASALPPLKAPSAAAAQRALAGSPGSLARLHRQAGDLLGSSASLTAGLDALRGYPVVLNVWQSSCLPCREEFSLFASASARFGRQVAFLGADTSDSASVARPFLAKHPVSYPSYQTSPAQLAPLAAIEGFPDTIFIDRAGKVGYVHIGQYDTLAPLENDIDHYALGRR
ncbi:MAG: SCO family protein [Actinomycetota bacterium]|nr:SCO family protein [Actinomycetota bacterium]